jgi:hypothetical protein
MGRPGGPVARVPGVGVDRPRSAPRRSRRGDLRVPRRDLPSAARRPGGRAGLLGGVPPRRPLPRDAAPALRRAALRRLPVGARGAAEAALGALGPAAALRRLGQPPRELPARRRAPRPGGPRGPRRPAAPPPDCDGGRPGRPRHPRQPLRAPRVGLRRRAHDEPHHRPGGHGVGASRRPDAPGGPLLPLGVRRRGMDDPQGLEAGLDDGPEGGRARRPRAPGGARRGVVGGRAAARGRRGPRPRG